VQFSGSNFVVNEYAGSATVTVTLNTASGTVVSVAYATSDGSAATDSDYTPASGILTLQPGRLPHVRRSIADDAINEISETVVLTLSGPVRATLG